MANHKAMTGYQPNLVVREQLEVASVSSGTPALTRIYQVVILDRSGDVVREVIVRALTVGKAASMATRGEQLSRSKNGNEKWLRAKVYLRTKDRVSFVRLFSSAS